MSRIVPLRPWHLRLLEPQPEQTLLAAGQLNEWFGAAVLAAGPAWACVDGDHVYGAGGVVADEGRLQAWTILGSAAGQHMTAITRAARRAVEAMPGRVDAHVREGWPASRRWAALIGFIPEGSIVIGPDGTKHELWVHNGR